MGRSNSASVVYCSIWVHSHVPQDSGLKNGYWSGRGTAGGGGYHKESAALAGAIESAGITLEGNIGGCGEGSMRHALTAIARSLGYEDFTIV